jgi:transposase-like protein
MDVTTPEIPEQVQHFTAKRRSALVLTILKGETSVREAARPHGLKVAEVEDWRDKFLLGAENALRSRRRNEEALRDEEIKRLKQKVGELFWTSTSSKRPAISALPSRGRRSFDRRAPRHFSPSRLSCAERASGVGGTHEIGADVPPRTPRQRPPRRSAPGLDPALSDLWVSAPVGVAALPGTPWDQ